LNRSQRILTAIGLVTLLALAAPYLTRAVVERRLTSGKAEIFQDHSYRPQKDLVLCLIKHPGALDLSVASNNLYTDPADDLTVKVVDKGDFRVVRAWLPQGRQLNPDQSAQLSECIAHAPEVKAS